MILRTTLAISANTIREALRERLLYNLLVFAVVLTGGSLTFSQLTLGEQFRIISDVATSSTQLFATLIAVFLGVSLFARELDRRTCYAVLARPVSRAGFVVGKAAGVLATVGVNVAIMAVVTGLVLWTYTRTFLPDRAFLGGTFAAVFLMIVMQSAICVAFAVLFAGMTTPTLAVIATLALVASGFLFGEVRTFWLQSRQVEMKGLVQVLDYLLPNMALLDLKEALTYDDPVTAASVLRRTAYGAAYAGTILALAAFGFSRKDVR
jgi:ABC-type transport system involved in multi-copper enzyme maturation permease subunit